MMRLRRASVIVTFSVLASAATASAECAWVLWVITDTDDAGLKQRHPDVYGMKVGEFYDTRAACETEAKSVREKAYKDDVRMMQALDDGKAPLLHQVEERGEYGYFTSMVERNTGKRVGWTAHAWRCFPDTIDPRGPKGK
jgi:hypothetical protein